ncbi:GntR family transcriptional regulator [Prosthecomicrobium pneumaticum]|uniref:DNA-binding GntR family transcriptional regulator n=1 Tax=Prosthecomicrobium pneumaticum TaxID=81895 RepID=A0A7W9L298_9HYPH|nr:GntR family transcriptional regulator [Prosthecomicrobium pneumaticum]MBB5753306.1 DNA-binding GntR family transcriptional regulator [Prosthecomicrobium pneumaticum]
MQNRAPPDRTTLLAPASGRVPPRSARAASIHAELLAAIVDRRLAPGTRLPEDEIGAIYGASRTIVRAALEALSHEGLVTIEPNRGAGVARPSVAEAGEVFQARGVIEPQVAVLAAAGATPEAIARLRACIEEEHAALHAGEHRRAIVLSGNFHNLIAEMAGQSILALWVRELVLRSSLILSLYWRRPELTCATPAHAALIDALAGGDAAAAARLMAEHIADLAEGLDLTERSATPVPLADLLAPPR